MTIEKVQRAEEIVIRGTRYYSALRLFRDEKLQEGLAVRLEHEPNNPHDKYAVAVKLLCDGVMLGHIPREIAQRYSQLVNEGRIFKSFIRSVSENKSHVKICILVAYVDAVDANNKQNESSVNKLENTKVNRIPARKNDILTRDSNIGTVHAGRLPNTFDKISSQDQTQSEVQEVRKNKLFSSLVASLLLMLVSFLLVGKLFGRDAFELQVLISITVGYLVFQMMDP